MEEVVQVTSVRETVEYEAAFDLELWKVEERKKFHAVLQREREAMISSLEQAYMKKDIDRLEDIDRIRRDLEGMGLRLQQAGAALQKRIASHEKREEAMNHRRRLLSEEHESHMQRMEARHRTALEENSLRQHQLEATIKERDSTIQQLQIRLTSSQKDYDTLQRAVAHMQSRERGSVETAAELTAAAEHLRQIAKGLQEKLDAKEAEIKVLVASRDRAVAECQEFKGKASRLSSKYKDLKAQCLQQQEKWLASERERMLSEIQQSHRAPSFASAAQHFVFPPQSSTGPFLSEVQELRQLVVDLQQEESLRQSEERRQKKKSKPKKMKAAIEVPSVQPLLYVERPLPTAHMVRRDTENISVSTMSSTEEFSVQPEDQHSRHSGADADETFDDVSTASTYPSVSFSQLLSSAGQAEDEDGVVTVQGSFHRALRPHGTTATALLSPFDPVTSSQPGDSTNRTPSARDSLGSVFRSPAQSPFFPSAEGSAAHHHSSDVIRPYVLPSASGQPLNNTTASLSTLRGSASDTKTSDGAPGEQEQQLGRIEQSLPDLQKFLRQLKANRDRLVNSGVYEASDPLVMEMDSKIRTYHRYLSMNLAVAQ